MRTLFWLFAVLATAVAVALFAQQNTGYVLLVQPPWRIELSLSLFVLLLLVSFFAGYALIRLLMHALSLPGVVSAWRKRQRHEKAREAMDGALLSFFEGRYAEAEKLATKALGMEGSSSPNPLLSALLAQLKKKSEIEAEPQKIHA